MYEWKSKNDSDKLSSVTDGAECESIQLVKHVASGKTHLLYRLLLALMELQM